MQEKQRETVPGFVSLYEWIDYWQADNDQWQSDDFEMNGITRSNLAWASQTINHMLATLRQISELDYSRAATNMAAFEAVLFAKNAIAEYGLGVETKTVSQAYSAPEEDKPLMPPWVH